MNKQKLREIHRGLKSLRSLIIQNGVLPVHGTFDSELYYQLSFDIQSVTRRLRELEDKGKNYDLPFPEKEKV